jgi:hypothetical protein
MILTRSIKILSKMGSLESIRCRSAEAGRVVTELDDPVACRPHRRAADVVRIGLPDLLTPCAVIIQGHLVLGIGQRRNLTCGRVAVGGHSPAAVGQPEKSNDWPCAIPIEIVPGNLDSVTKQGYYSLQNGTQEISGKYRVNNFRPS